MYLDNAATSFPKPESVYDAVDHWMRNNGTAFGRGQHALAEANGHMVQQCRVQLTRLLGLPAASHVALTFNCTDSLNLIIRGLVRPGDRVIATTMEHNSVLRPLHQLQDEIGLLFDLVDFDPVTGLVDPADFERSLHESSARLAVISHASNVTGVIQPVREIVDLAHQAGTMVMLDAAQTAGHVPFSMKDLDVDFLAAAGHKGLLGPLGTGILAVRPGLEKLIQPIRCGGTGSSSESMRQPSQMPDLLESGNMNLPGICGLQASTQWLSSQTVDAVHRHTLDLTKRLAAGLRDMNGVRIYGPLADDAAVADCCPILSMNIDGLDCRDVAMILDQSFDIQTRAGLHCAPLAHRTLNTFDLNGAVRFSPGCFTEESQIDAALSAIAEIAQSQ
ncbi:MAG: aminotransferase class V-fold PLP-dependent enzyme [Planctomycetaceae bacterium]|nr:aminotransferase class V-fold PLP-dependent enzyme [Planctomycetaceae bacterium]